MNSYKKPYPKTYIIMAVAFAGLFLGVWSFYGILYQKDMQVNRHCKIGLLANSVSEYAYNAEIADVSVIENELAEINKIAEKTTLDDMEKSCLDKLNKDVAKLRTEHDAATFSDVEHSAKYLLEASQDNTEKVVANSKQSHITGDYIMMSIFILVIGAIVFIGTLVRKKESALAMKEEENSRLESNVKNAKDKAYEIAYKNFIMDCGNRYALDEHIEAETQNSSFCMTQFDIADYQNILAAFGYNKMDNCLGRVSGAIKKKFGDYGSLFAINDETLVFVFSNKVSVREAEEKSEYIRRLISETISSELHVDAPITGAILCTHHFKGNNSNEILTALYNAAQRSIIMNPLPVV